LSGIKIKKTRRTIYLYIIRFAFLLKKIKLYYYKIKILGPALPAANGDTSANVLQWRWFPGDPKNQQLSDCISGLRDCIPAVHSIPFPPPQ
jgi:hypothetical protein